MGAALYADWVNLNSFEIHPFVDWMNWVFFSEKCLPFGNTCCGNMENMETWNGEREKSSTSFQFMKTEQRYRSFGHFDCCCVCPQVCGVLKVKIGTPNSFHIILGSDTRLSNTCVVHLLAFVVPANYFIHEFIASGWIISQELCDTRHPTAEKQHLACWSIRHFIRQNST